jgi:DNA-binding transcriptional LysR family regulator
MEMRQLQIFVALAEELNFTRTAARLNTAQSNITSHVRHLETELGARLVDRLPRQVALTEAGRQFLPYAQRVLATVEEARQALQDQQEPAGPLRVGAPESVLTYRLPTALHLFRHRHPNVKLVLRPCLDWPLTQTLQNGELDLVIRLADSFSEKSLETRNLGPERVLLVAAPDHPLAQRSHVRPADFALHQLLLTEGACAYRTKFERILGQQGVTLHGVTEFASVEAIKQCAMLGMGIALLPEIVVTSALENQTLTALKWRGPALDVARIVVWHRDRWMTPAMSSFLQAICETMTNETEAAVAIAGHFERCSTRPPGVETPG